MTQRLTQSQTFDAAEQKKDESILLHIRGKDCVAVEACYHKKCYTSYTNFLNYKLVEDKEERLYEKLYQQFCKQVVEKKIITDKEVMLMTKLFDYFVKCVQDTEGLDVSNYRRFHLKTKLKLTYPQLVFHKPSKSNMSELVFCEDLSVGVIAAGHISMCDSSDTETTISDIEIRDTYIKKTFFNIFMENSPLNPLPPFQCCYFGPKNHWLHHKKQ